MIKGACECGGITFEFQGALPYVVHCRGTQCRKTSGRAWASVFVQDATFSRRSDDTLKRRGSCEFAKRGFCPFCGSSFFYKHNDESNIAVAARTVETATGLGFDRHIFVKDKGDYDHFDKHEPQIQRY